MGEEARKRGRLSSCCSCFWLSCKGFEKQTPKSVCHGEKGVLGPGVAGLGHGGEPSLGGGGDWSRAQQDKEYLPWLYGAQDEKKGAKFLLKKEIASNDINTHI